MRLYVVRHGEAVSMSTVDESRELTSAGKRSVNRFWHQLWDEGVRPAAMMTSPYVRASQTAEEIRRVLPGIGTEVSSLLTPDGSPEAVCAGILAGSALESLILVSHMPLVSLLTAYLTGLPRSQLSFATGGVAALDFSEPLPALATLLWHREPDRLG